MDNRIDYAGGSRPISSRYEAYEKRIQRIGRVLHWIRHHKFISLLILTAVTALVLVFLNLIGTFMGPMRCEDFVYGEEPQISCNAFLYRPRYEFAAANCDVWTQEVPVFPGQYQVRAYTKDGFGNLNYTEVKTFSIHRRDLTIQIQSGAYIYGDMSEDFLSTKTQIKGLAEGDAVIDINYGIEEDDGRNYSVVISDFRVTDSYSTDVGSCYNIEVIDGAFTVQPRPLTIKVDDAEKIYDGEVFNGGSAQIISGSLAEEDCLLTTFATLPADAGKYNMVPELQIVSVSGEDVTKYYDLSVRNGVLSVVHRPLILQSGSAEKVYDAKILTEQTWELLHGDTVPGHKLDVQVLGKQKGAGQSENSMFVTITDVNGLNVSDNYAIEMRFGTLTIHPIVLKVRSDSAEKVYDGKVLSAGGELVSGEVLKGHKVFINKQYEVVNVGTYKNVPEVTVKNKQGLDVTAEGYKIEFEYGTLVITPRPITVTSRSAEKLYDGYALVCHEYSITSGSLGAQGGKEGISNVNFTGKQTEVGSSPNTFGIFIFSINGFDTTANYEITYEYGTLTVLENPDYKDPDDGQMSEGELGSGTNISFPEDDGADDTIFAYVTGLQGMSTGTNVYLRTQSYGDYTLVGWKGCHTFEGFNESYEPLKSIGQILAGFGNTPAKIHIKRMNGCPVIMPYFTADPTEIYTGGNDCFYAKCPQEFDISLFKGLNYSDIVEMMLKHPNTSAEEEYRKFVYDEYLSVPSSTSYSLLNWAKQKGINADSPTLVQDIQMAVTRAAVYNMDAEDYPADVDVVVYFLTEAKEGICQHFASAATLIYRCFGIPARYTGGFATTVTNGETTQVTGKNAHAWVEIYIDGAGWVPIEVTPGGNGGSGSGGSLTISGYNAVKFYDGKPFDIFKVDAFTVEDGFLLPGHTLKVSFRDVSKFVEPGIYYLEVQKYAIYDRDGKNVTDQYGDIQIKPGVIRILKRKITITTGSASKQFDGLPLRCLDYWISQGSLAPGDELSVRLPAVLTEPGRVENSAKNVKIQNTGSKKPKDVTDCYEIEIISGVLEIIASP